MDRNETPPDEPGETSHARVFNTPGIDEFLSAYYNLKLKFGQHVTNIAAPHERPIYHKRSEQDLNEWDRAFNEASSPDLPSETSTPPQKAHELNNIIKNAIKANSQAGWLESIPRIDIQTVVNTVQVLRAKGLDDWQIYVKYRRLAETNPNLTQKVQILDAFVAGVVGKQMEITLDTSDPI